jgi:hypothetical protein
LLVAAAAVLTLAELRLLADLAAAGRAGKALR